MPEIEYLKSEEYLSTERVREFLRTTNKFFALLDRESLISEVQLMAAWEHVKRNHGNKVRDDATLLMLYLSGSSQISNAYEAVGIKPETRRIVAFYEDRADLEKFLKEFPAVGIEEPAGHLPKDCPDRDSIVFGKISRVELDLS